MKRGREEGLKAPEKRLKTANSRTEEDNQLVYRRLSSPRPVPLTVDGYTLHQYAFVGNAGHPTPKKKKVKDAVTGRWRATGEMNPAKEARWVQKDRSASLPPSTAQTALSISHAAAGESGDPHWDRSSLNYHIRTHAHEPWFKAFFGEGEEGQKRYEQESKKFARIVATDDLVRRYNIACDSAVYAKSGEDLAIYSYKNNMLHPRSLDAI